MNMPSDVIMPDPIDSGEFAIRAEHETQINQSGRWFFWLAGLSLINSIIFLADGDIQFIFGLAITQYVDAIMKLISEGSANASLLSGLGFVINLIIAGMVAGMGVFAIRGIGWIFLVGMVLYAIDGILFLIAESWLGVLFHLWVFFAFFRGFRACNQLKSLDSSFP
ncbi:MAG: hypothetical protein H6510_13260 [Acidobacteria bacterium]|nr:hypothetical protein [Acidobacteriota bacterium]MCB9398776.1 hypothetical protein [Acidobacteriota bacterium]